MITPTCGNSKIKRKLSYLQHLGVDSLAKGGKGSTTVLPKAPAPAPAPALAYPPSPSPKQCDDQYLTNSL